MHHNVLQEMPLVSVVIPVCNGERYILKALESILNQSYQNLEVILIDDGSTDNSLKEIETVEDDRIILVKNESNRGIAYSLNRGIRVGKGEFIARMDADDIALTDRIDRQVRFLHDNSDIGIVGTAYNIIDAYGRVCKKIQPFETDIEIRCALLFLSPFAHPTVMIRKNILEKFNVQYDERFEYVEDYELWSRLLNYSKGANIPVPLMNYRRHEGSISIVKNKKQREFGNRIRRYNMYKYAEKEWVDRLNIDRIVEIFSDDIADMPKPELLISYKQIVGIIYKFNRAQKLTVTERRQLSEKMIKPVLSNLIYYSLMNKTMKFKERTEMLAYLFREAYKYKYYPSARGILNKCRAILN